MRILAILIVMTCVSFPALADEPTLQPASPQTPQCAEKCLIACNTHCRLGCIYDCKCPDEGIDGDVCQQKCVDPCESKCQHKECTEDTCNKQCSA